MAAFRILAWILVAIAIALLGADGVSSLESGEPVMRSTEMVLSLFGIGIIGVVMTLIFRPME
jgi:hypothetical protein